MLKFSSNRQIKTFIAALMFAAVTIWASFSASSGHGEPTELAQASVTYAQDSNSSTDLSTGGAGLTISQDEVTISSAISQKTFGATIIAIVNYFIGFLGLLATIAFVYAGVLWIVSGGNDEMIGKAKKIMTYASLGIVVVILSYSAVSFITRSAGEAGTVSTGAACTSDSDCSTGSTCLLGQCTASTTTTTTTPPANAVQGSTSTPAYSDNLDTIDDIVDDLEDELDISSLSSDTQAKVESALKSGTTLADKVDKLEDLLETGDLSSAEEAVVLKLIDGLDNLKILRDELDELEKTMPQSKAINDAYDDASDALDELIKDPTDRVLSSRFISKYKTLKDLIKKFPAVKAAITAYPGSGNVPFTVQFDGLNSSDPTGGTIGNYNWSYLDSSGSEVSLGSDPVVLYEFTTANTYAVKLTVSTSQLDSDGYKTAADGVSVVRVKANPPTSVVKFRINGSDVVDTHSVTLKEGQAGVSFDPSPTTAASGRKIAKYEWSYGDTLSETRLVPTTVVHAYTKTGEYYVKLAATDNVGIKDTKIVKLTVKSLAGNIQVTPSTGNVNTEFKFAGTNSRSDDGVISKYDWTIHDSKGTKVTDSDKSNFTYRFTSPGTYDVTLLVTDITGATDKVVKEFKVTSRDPVASFSYSTPELNYPNKIEFSAIDSYDPDQGDTLTYSWDFDGDGTFDEVDSKTATTTYTYTQKGDYNSKLQVKDAFGLIDQTTNKISIKSTLSGEISVDRVATPVGKTVNFIAKSKDAVAYLWEFGDGNKESTEKTTVTYTYNKTGKYTVKLHFFDKDNNSNTDKATILVGAGDQPLAVIDYVVNSREPRTVDDLCGTDMDGAVVSRDDKISFDGNNSINTDGSSRLLSYDWKFPDGTTSSSKETTYKFDELNREGECFSVSLVVRDQLTGKLSKEDKAYFKVTNKLPTVTDFVITPPDKTKMVTPAKVQMKVINPKDADGTIKKYTWWYYLDGTPAKKLGVHSTSTSTTDMTITSFGQADITNRYYFVVEVSDNDNGTFSSAERFGEVSYLDIKNGPNLSPVAEFTLDKTTISAGDSISFVSKSYDPQGETLSNDAYMWDFDGDGSFDDTSSGPQVNRQFNTPGEFIVRLKVVHRGLSSSTTKTVYVETTESLPQAAFTYSVDGNKVNFNGAHTRYDPTLTDTTLRFKWDFDTGTDADGNGTKDDDSESTEMKPTYTYIKAGIYKAKLTVTDSLGQEGVVARDINLNLTDAQRKSAGYSSLKVSAPKHSITTLDIEVIPISLKTGESADVKARVLNADGSAYTGQVYFTITDGSGSFTPNPVTASDSTATSVFTASDTGSVKIKVRATGTSYGELTEEATITVK